MVVEILLDEQVKLDLVVLFPSLDRLN